MNNFLNRWATKKNVLLLSMALLSLFLVFVFNRTFGLCSSYQVECTEHYRYIWTTIYWTPVFAFFSLVMFFFSSEGIFKKWVRFAIPWIVLSFLATVFVPDSWGHDIYAPLHEKIAGLFAIIFFMISALFVLFGLISRKK